MTTYPWEKSQGAQGAYGVMEMFTHSYGRGTGLDAGYRDPTFQTRLGKLLGVSRIYNYAFLGAPIHDPTSGFGYMLQYYLRPRLAGPDVPYSDIALSFHGINDLMQVSDGRVWRNYQRLYHAVARTSRMFAWNDASIAYGGAGWADSTPAVNVYGTWGRFGNGGSFKTTPNAGTTVTLTVPADYDGKGAAVLLFPVVPASNYSGTIGVTRGGQPVPLSDPKDEQAVGTFQALGTNATDGTLNGVAAKRVLVPGGFRAGDIITITCTDVTGGPMNFNAWGVEANPVPSGIIANVPRIPGYGIQGANPFPENDARVALWNTQHAPVVAEFDQYVVGLDADKILNKDPLLFEPGAFSRHPNSRGYALLARAMQAIMPRRSPIDQSLVQDGPSWDLFMGPGIGLNLTGPGGANAQPNLKLGADGMAVLYGAFMSTALLAAGATLVTIPGGMLPRYHSYSRLMADDGNTYRVRLDGAEGISSGVSVKGRIQVIDPIPNGTVVHFDGMTWPAER